MKKIAFLILACFMSLTIQAQVEHIKFMGIPVDGTLKTFEKQLKKKGFIPDARFKVLPKEYFPDSKIFKGAFSDDYNVTLVVKCDKETKIVNTVNVIIECNTETEMVRKYESYLSKYKEKYEGAKIVDFQSERKDGVSIGLYNSNHDDLIGMICLAKDIAPDTHATSVTIEYIDVYNMKAASANSLNDL